ncbi:MAG: SMI1/KNR4 family protein [Chloroflexi bacterium]|nr:SMI1/KNR4 family protein [Chloroflexota bacterium]
MGISEMSDSTLRTKGEVLALLRKVPAPPEDSLPAGASNAALQDAESTNGILFPPKLRDWLSTSNGACVGPGGLVGIDINRDSHDLAAIFDNYPIWRDKGWIPVAGDGCGNYYVVATRNDYGAGEPVLFVDANETPDEPAFIAASDTWLFLKFLLSKEVGESRWPFNEAEVVTSDPDIVSFENVCFPWNA